MSRLARASALALCLLTIRSAPAFAHRNPAAAADVVFLASREPDRIEDSARPAPSLARELVRQAFLIAARNECGFSTRDATLREELPTDPSARPVHFELFTAARTQSAPEVHYVLSRVSGGKAERVWEWKRPGDFEDPLLITKLAEEAEGLSRGALKAVLERAHGVKPLPPVRKSAGVPHEAQERLWEFNEFAVLDALRRIHAEIDGKGESPELLAALAIGYANLGSLTGYQFSPAHKSFSARALLYAERLVHKNDRSSWGLWHRAYVRAIVGLHDLAQSDIAAAKKGQGDLQSLQPLPFWTGTIDAFCQGRLPQMLEQAQTQEQRRLAGYLNLEAAIYSGVGSVITKAAQSVIEQSPDCLRAWDAMCIPQQLGVLQAVTGRAFGSLSSTLRARLAKFEGLPEAVTRQLSGSRHDVDVEVGFRVQLVMQLTAEREPRAQRGEPSLAVLGRMIEEVEFAQLFRRVQLEANVWGVSTDDTVSTYRPLCEHHRYAALIDTFGRTPAQVGQAIATLAGKIEPAELGYVETLALQPLRPRDETRIGEWTKFAYAHADPVFRDEMLGLQAGAAGKPTDKQANGPYMEMLWTTSSQLPAVVAARITRDWRHARPEAPAIEKRFANDFVVMTALTLKYVDLEQFDDAERCAKRRIEITPTYGAYRMLATIYKKQGDMLRWEATLRDSLRLPSPGLEESQVRNQLARYHMDRKEWKQAVEDADAAAASYAAWAMLTASRCHEMLGEWQKSEALMRAISERYDGLALEWALWCCRTGHGDLQAADDCARRHFESLGTTASPQALERIGTYYLLKKEPEKALAVFGKAFDDGRGPYIAMHAALAADGLGKAPQRDDYLQKIVDAAKTRKPTSVAGVYGRVAALMQRALPPGRVEDFDLKQVDAILTTASDSPRPGEANLSYFVAVFLKNRGQADRSRDYLLRCARAQQYRRFNYALACQMLRELKIPVPAPSGPELSEDDEGGDAIRVTPNRGKGAARRRR